MPCKHLTPNDRYVIYHLVVFDIGYREIGRHLGKHHTTISREIKRNWKGLGLYWHEAAQLLADSKKAYCSSYQKT